ncbi:MAG TPA: NAD-dependent deacylase [Spirochaetota bacterium]|mgnify:CR=1 FL=1|nr:NAD-dependent deacylase [Spirochaetota bacterium]HOJ27812.1 NAD-dependent deacylase [Spirochaetota bacterium]HOM08870.1 NAD-dependent deacylase [Spirochaetota bacterium]HPP48665.1 NAD-dependent deacylase [Spirochaetota bacterium]
MDDLIKTAAKIVKDSISTIALTGAGISVESGIPDFRSAGGLWTRYNPEEYAHIDGFRRNPRKIWKMIFELMDMTRNAMPNPAHIALAQLEEMGLLKAVITQNIDNLHQRAGSKNVIEFHGNSERLQCIYCGAEYAPDEFVIENEPPQCKKCGEILKPSVVFFGEMIPHNALMESQNLASDARVVLVIGTSAVVYPASSIPHIAKANGAYIIEFNLEKTVITPMITDIFIQGKVGETLPKFIEAIKALQA